MSAFRISLSLVVLIGATHLLTEVLPASAQQPVEVRLLLLDVERLLASHPPQPDSAAKRLSHVLDQEPDHWHAQALDLWRRYAHEGTFLPALHQERLRRAARRLLDTDSTNAVAHLVLGALKLDQYRNQKDRVSIPVRYSDGNVMDVMMGYLDPRREDRRDLGIVRDANTERAYSKAAETHLTTAFRNLDSPMSDLAAVRLAALALLLDKSMLGLEVANGVLDRHPSSTLGHELAALFHLRSGRLMHAWSAAERALEVMTEEERSLVLDREPVQRPSQPRAEGDWLDDDPRWETPENERLAEHVARRVALRLLGYPPESDPGRLIVRYGLPTETVRFSSDRDDFMAVSYPFTTFIFHDMAKSGEWIFWSSSAADLTGPRNVIRQWQRDQTIHAAEQFDSTPIRSGVSPGNVLSLRAAVYGFGLRGAREYVVVWCQDASETKLLRHFGLYAAQMTENQPRVGPGPLPVVLSEWTEDNPVTEVGSECQTSPYTVRTAASYHRFSLEIRDSQGRTGAVRTRTAPVPSSGPVMSDLVLARLVTESTGTDDVVPRRFFRRGDRLIEPLLPRVSRPGEPLAVYFEVHGLDATYRGQGVAAPTFKIEAVLAPVDKRDQTTVAVSFLEVVQQGIWARDFILDLDGVKPGAYHLTVRVTDISGNLAVLEQSTTLEMVSR